MSEVTVKFVGYTNSFPLNAATFELRNTTSKHVYYQCIGGEEVGDSIDRVIPPQATRMINVVAPSTEQPWHLTLRYWMEEQDRFLGA